MAELSVLVIIGSSSWRDRGLRSTALATSVDLKQKASVTVPTEAISIDNSLSKTYSK